MWNCWLLVAIALLVPLVLGCGNAGPKMGQVTGHVSYQGKPLAGAQVVFSPADGSPKAAATTDESGHYVLGTNEPGDGAIVGRHLVSITARGPGKPLPPDQSGTGLPGNALDPGDPLIPRKYFSTATSGLEKDVAAGSNEIDFDL